MKFLKELVQIGEAAKSEKKLKPRARNLNTALMSKRNEKHYSAKSDYVRAKEKSKNKGDLHENEDRKYYSYSVWYELKDYGDGDGRDENETGITTGVSEESVKADLKRRFRRAYDIQLKELSKEQYDKLLKEED